MFLNESLQSQTPQRAIQTLLKSQHQEVRVVNIADTVTTLTKLCAELKTTSTIHGKKQKIKSLESLSLCLVVKDIVTSQQIHDTDVIALFQAVVKCFPRLKAIEISAETSAGNDSSTSFQTTSVSSPASSGNEFLFVPVQAMTVLLHPKKGLKRLQELTLDGLCFNAMDEAAMRLLSKAISKHDALETVYLYDTSMTPIVLPAATANTTNKHQHRRSGLEKFVAALAKKVSKMALMGCRFGVPEELMGGKHQEWAGSCLIKVCQSTTLQEVKLHNLWDLREEHIVLMAQTLATNHTLRKLSLLKAPDMTPASNKKKKSKKKDKSDSLSSDAGALALANMLRQNRTLEEVCLSAVDFNDYASLFIGKALEEANTTLQNLWLMIPGYNGSTSSFPVDDKRIDYWLRLNRAGRARFVQYSKAQEQQALMMEQQQDTKDEDVVTTLPPRRRLSVDSLEHLGRRESFVDSLIQSKRDIDCTFFKLRQCPFLCDNTTLTTSATISSNDEQDATVTHEAVDVSF